LAVAVALGACGSDSGTTNPHLPSPPPEGLPAGVAGTADALASDLTSFTVIDPSAGFGGFFSAKRPAGQVLQLAQAAAPARVRPLLAKFANLAAPQACDFGGTVDSGVTTDSDGDGIPDNQVATFANCVGLIDTVQVDNETVIETYTITGSLGVSDAKTMGDLLAYAANFDHLILSVVQEYSASGTYSLSFEYNGTFGARWAPALASSAEDVALNFVESPPAAAPPRPTANATISYSETANFTVAFAPAQGSSIDLQSAFPSGQFSFGGSFAWSGNDGTTEGNWEFDLSTDAPGLVYDSGCALDPPFTSGVVRGTLHLDNTAGFTVTYAGCGQAPVESLFGFGPGVIM
jgi:hypothetical protein